METLKSTSCCKAKKIPIGRGMKANGTLSFFSTLLLILLPKCPLCIGAYTGAALLFFDISNAEVAPILLHAKPVLGASILIMILLNRRGKRTILAAAIASTALILLILSTYFYRAYLSDVILYFAFFFAIWYNGNFSHFYRFIRFRKT
ncbi:hypothetical protein [Spongiimicrobium salis]|uniref:hypothetical protein n=1 Tax=Spongiimicrobium salis TaxID=1667022 RepID=UPI00374DE617